MALLEVDDIHVLYGNIEAVRGLSIKVDPGEMVAILGSNGAGKTTTLRTISGLERARSGSITYDGKEITRLPAHTIVGQGLCQVPEGRRIFGTLTVAENLNLGGYVLRGHPQELRTRRRRVFDVFPRLAERSHQLAGTLSGGEQQMLAIGRALIGNPRILLLDEPLEGLAPIIVDELLSALRQVIRDEGLATIMVEQNVKKVLALADRVAVIERGAIVHECDGAAVRSDQRTLDAYLGLEAKHAGPSRRNGGAAVH